MSKSIEILEDVRELIQSIEAGGQAVAKIANSMHLRNQNDIQRLRFHTSSLIIYAQENLKKIDDFADPTLFKETYYQELELAEKKFKQENTHLF